MSGDKRERRLHPHRDAGRAGDLQPRRAGLLRLGGATAANSARLQEQAIAQIVAENVAVETADRSRRAAVRDRRRAGGQWRAALGLDADIARSPEARIQQIEIAVTSLDGGPGRARLHHFPAGRAMKRNGFTLIEMLIALTIFGMLTAAGVALLSVTARTQETSDRLLAEFGRGAAARRLAHRRSRPGGAAHPSRRATGGRSAPLPAPADEDEC